MRTYVYICMYVYMCIIYVDSILVLSINTHTYIYIYILYTCVWLSVIALSISHNSSLLADTLPGLRPIDLGAHQNMIPLTLNKTNLFGGF